MTLFAGIPDLKRVRFEAGQSLLARDLTDMQRNCTELRWLHNRTFHGWGIASGCTVSGYVGGSQLSVGTGFALDCMGRELLLTDEAVMAIPHSGDNSRTVAMYLVIGYRSDDRQQVIETRTSTCLPGGTVRLTNDVDLSWRTRNQLRRGYDIVLARVFVRNCAVVERLDFSVRRYIPVCDGPTVASGYASSRLDWRLMDNAIGISCFIDTSEAGFQRTPGYRVEILGDRVTADGETLLVPFKQVHDPSATGFTLNVLLPELGHGVNRKSVRERADEVARKLGWRVSWLGVEG